MRNKTAKALKKNLVSMVLENETLSDKERINCLRRLLPENAMKEFEKAYLAGKIKRNNGKTI